MTPLQADQKIIDSRRRLASIGSSLDSKELASFTRNEMLELELLALAVPSKAVKIHRVLAQWRQLYFLTCKLSA